VYQDTVDVKEMEKELKKLHKQNKILEKENNVLIQEKDDLENIKEEKEKLEFELQTINDLKEENERLANENKILSAQVNTQDEVHEKETLGPIQLVFCGGSYLQEKTIFAPPDMPMGIVIEKFCTENTQKRLEFAFYTNDNRKKIYI